MAKCFFNHTHTKIESPEIQSRFNQNSMQYSGMENLLADLLFQIVPNLQHALPVCLGESVKKSVGVEGGDGNHRQEEIVVHLWFVRNVSWGYCVIELQCYSVIVLYSYKIVCC